MQQKLQKQAVGLDIGQTGAKLVCLERRGRRVVLTRREVLDAREEGILDVDDLYHSIGKWLGELKLLERRMCLGMPQYLATTQVSDFAPGAKPDELEKMVGYETQQLAGLSEETFISDYQVMQPAYGRQNPVLIGVCRETTVEEYAARATEEGIRLSDVAMSGLAIANTFFHLHPEEVNVKAPQLLVDIGHENASILVVASGQVLYVGSLMFGALRFSQAMAHSLGCSEQEADKLKRTLQQDWSDPQCPLLLAARQLETELRTAIDHWRASEQEALAGELIHRIWLCGGGALLPGLTDHLTRTYGCPVECFGPPTADGKGIDPTLAVAFGLALQGMGAAAYGISLAPTLLRWQRRKVARFPYLVAAVVLFFGALLTSMVVADWWLRQETAHIESLMGELNQCQSLVPELDSAQEQIAFQQKLLVPFVEHGSRSQRFMRTLEKLHETLVPGAWCIYVADEFSFREYGPAKEEKATKEPPKPTAFDGMFGTVASEYQTSTSEPENPMIEVLAMPLLSKMVACGYIPYTEQRFTPLREMENALKAATLPGEKQPYFLNPGWLDEKDLSGREEQVFRPWVTYLKNKDNRNILGEYTAFLLQLPFSTRDVRPPPPPPPKKTSGRRR